MKYFSIAAIIVSVFALSGTASGQRMRPRETRGHVVNKAQVKAIINRVETRVDYFVKQFDKSLDRSRLNGSDREDQLNKRAKDLEHATDDMRKHFDVTDKWIDNRDEVRKCLNIATDINTAMVNRKLGGVTETNWANVRYELNTLADVYNLPRVGAAAY